MESLFTKEISKMINPTNMRTLTILIFGLIFSLSGCEKDPTPGKAICKPENRPRLDEMDSQKPRMNGW